MRYHRRYHTQGLCVAQSIRDLRYSAAIAMRLKTNLFRVQYYQDYGLVDAPLSADATVGKSSYKETLHIQSKRRNQHDY